MMRRLWSCVRQLLDLYNIATGRAPQQLRA